MTNNDTFRITYFAKKHGKHITRNAKWTDKKGNDCYNFWDIDAKHPRTAVNCKVRKA